MFRDDTSASMALVKVLARDLARRLYANPKH